MPFSFRVSYFEPASTKTITVTVRWSLRGAVMRRMPLGKIFFEKFILERFLEMIIQFRDCNSLLLAAVAVTDCNSIVFFDCIEINSDTERCTYLVLPAVALADIAMIIKFNTPKLFFEHCIHFPRLFH